MILGIHHVQITVPVGAEAAARAFYCGVLGLQEIEKPEALRGRGGLWLRVGEREVHVGVQDRTGRQADRAHIAYQVTDLARWRSIILDQGIEIGESIQIPGNRRLEFRDPFGNRIELIQPA